MGETHRVPTQGHHLLSHPGADIVGLLSAIY